MSDLFYMQDNRSCTGNNVTFWREGGCGYGTNLDELKVYTLADAQRQHDSRGTDIPLLKSLVDELSIMAVDCQYLPESCINDPKFQYVVQRKGHWNGNDISFIGRDGPTYDYTKALVYNSFEIDSISFDSEIYTVFSKSEIDKIARRTFQVGNIDKRAMITKPGIKLVKPKRQRETTGKTRGNCPKCGKITWDFNPHESAYCSHWCEMTHDN